MKKLKLNTSKLALKKGTIVNLSSLEMMQVVGGETGPCTSYPCGTGTYVPTLNPYSNTCPPPPAPPPPPPPVTEGYSCTGTTCYLGSAIGAGYC